MKKLFLFLAVSGLIFVSCGKKAEPTTTPAPAPQETVAPAPAPTPAPEPAPAPAKETKKVEPKKEVTPTPVGKKEGATVTESKKIAPITVKTTTKPAERTLEEKLKHLNEYTPEEQKAIINEAQKQGLAIPGTSTKTKKGIK